MSQTPLSVLDLIPVTSGSTPAQALQNSLDLARAAEQAGYRRYWFAEHHLNPGVIGASPAVAIALAAAATEHIRVGSAGFQLGHRTALSVAEEAGLLDLAFPGRVDLGLGRSAGRPAKAASPESAVNRASNGLVVPATFDPSALLASPRFALQRALLQLPGAESPDYTEQVGDLLDLLAGRYQYQGLPGHASPGEGADVEVWILGSSAGESAALAGARGLRFAANYHVAPSGILGAVAAYREQFRPSDVLDSPYVSVSADVVVADDDETARDLAAGYPAWVRSIRSGAGAIAYPSPTEAAGFSWTDAERALVADRVQTQFVGSPSTVATRLHELQEATDADELVVTTITHQHEDRVRSLQLLAKEWWG